jgi:hypothetical protein
MSIMNRFPSRYLKPAEIEPGLIATIDRVDDEIMGERQESKPVIHFGELSKPCVLNKTNALTLASAFGDDELGWGGRQVELSVIRVRKPGGGGVVDSIAMVPVKASKAKVVSEYDDSSPF